MHDEDDIPTRQIQKVNWLPPVKRPDQLPKKGVVDGDMCFVEGEGNEALEEIWEYRQGSWIRIDEL